MPVTEGGDVTELAAWLSHLSHVADANRNGPRNCMYPQRQHYTPDGEVLTLALPLAATRSAEGYTQRKRFACMVARGLVPAPTCGYARVVHADSVAFLGRIARAC